MGVLSGLEPERVFYYFEEMTKIPHGTYNTKAISDWCVNFAKENGLEVIQDEANNVIIKKPASAGYEDRDAVILQGHLDMVCERTDTSNHNFLTDPLKLEIKDGCIHAVDTSLGADDGIAIAMSMAILEDKTLEHPAIEAVFTTEEEVGMDGAEALDFKHLAGTRLINIDSEEEGEFTVGCAGGFRYTSRIPLDYIPAEGVCLKVELKGLLGGHSGIEIHKQRGNAHALMGRLLAKINTECTVNIVDVNGGSKNNVISRVNTTRFCVAAAEIDSVKQIIDEMFSTWLEEYGSDEPYIDIEVTEDTATEMATIESSLRVINYMNLMPNGVIWYERMIPGQVETSINAGVVRTVDGTVEVCHMVRSSVESQKMALKDKLDAMITLVGGKGQMEGNYPAWAYKRDSKLRDTMVKVFNKCYGRDAKVLTVHAGLECGLFLGKRPGLDCVSFGPDMFAVHSIEEHLSIDSVTRSYKYLVEVLRNL